MLPKNLRFARPQIPQTIPYEEKRFYPYLKKFGIY